MGFIEGRPAPKRIQVFRPEPAVEESYELLRDWTYNLVTPPRTLSSYCCSIILWYVLFVEKRV